MHDSDGSVSLVGVNHAVYSFDKSMSCASDTGYSVLTNIYNFRKWIQENIGKFLFVKYIFYVFLK